MAKGRNAGDGEIGEVVVLSHVGEDAIVKSMEQSLRRGYVSCVKSLIFLVSGEDAVDEGVR